MLVRPDDDGPRYVDLDYTLHTYFQALLAGQPAQLQAKWQSLVIVPERAYSSLEEYARLACWYARKGGRFTQHRVSVL
jgi:hypothetical protein